jgi:hypothetical protein
MTERHSPERAVSARDAALVRMRRLTGGLIALAVALAGVFTGVAASSTHPRKLVRRVRHAAAPTTTPALPPPPAAPAEAVPAAPSGEEPGTVTPSPAPSAPVQPPVSAPSPPVVVSGGS